MIAITNKQNCCGCSACAQRCPKQCISMQADSEGFLYPKVDMGVCIDCHLCEKVCPVINPNEPRTPLGVYAAKNANDEVRMASSSGGIFTCLAQRVLAESGVVFGARWDDDWNVVHDYVEKKDDIAKFRGSKYIQSNMRDCFKEAEIFLNSGRKVLFSGTPCQIAGLTRFLRKDYDNLLKVEVVCHGVPSQGLWKEYIAEQTSMDGKSVHDLRTINFRDKENGWERYNVVLEYNDGQRNVCYHGKNYWMRSFITNLNLRPSCLHCPSKCNESCADITLGDFWGIVNFFPEKCDDKGYTMIVCHTDRGREFTKDYNKGELSFTKVVAYNKSLACSAKENPKRKAFFRDAPKGFIKSVDNLTKEPLVLRIKLLIAKLMK